MGIAVDVLFLGGVFCVREEDIAAGPGIISAWEEKGSIVFFYIDKETVILLHLYQERVGEPGICLELRRQCEEGFLEGGSLPVLMGRDIE